jgi:hypothetical protein
MLPEWAETNIINGCHVLYGGFNPAWAAGAFERQVVNSLAAKLGSGHAVVVPTWYEPTAVVAHVNQLQVDSVHVCSLTDPMGSIVGYEDQLHGRVQYFGYTMDGQQFDFWAKLCSTQFRSYTIHDLQPTQFDHVYLNYNRKPHPHRVNLVARLDSHGLLDHGCVTLSGRLTVEDSDTYQDAGANDVIGVLDIPNDIFSLGQLRIWQRHFLNVVSETEFSPNSCFLSEKTFKPIVGLRPFIINGNPKIYTWLKRAGFDVFEDIFPVTQLTNTTNAAECHTIIVESIKQLVGADLHCMYQSLYPRLLYNKQRFHEYSNCTHS